MVECAHHLENKMDEVFLSVSAPLDLDCGWVYVYILLEYRESTGNIR